MLEVGSESWRSTLLFRGLLRSHPELAGEYAREKQRLAGLYAADRRVYQRKKDDVVRRILSRAGSGTADAPNT